MIDVEQLVGLWSLRQETKAHGAISLGSSHADAQGQHFQIAK